MRVGRNKNAIFATTREHESTVTLIKDIQLQLQP